MKFKKFITSVKKHKDFNIKIHIFAQFLGIINPLKYSQFLFYLLGLKFINTYKQNIKIDNDPELEKSMNISHSLRRSYQKFRYDHQGYDELNLLT